MTFTYVLHVLSIQVNVVHSPHFTISYGVLASQVDQFHSLSLRHRVVIPAFVILLALVSP
jgi:hypothetical protein